MGKPLASKGKGTKTGSTTTWKKNEEVKKGLTTSIETNGGAEGKRKAGEREDECEGTSTKKGRKSQVSLSTEQRAQAEVGSQPRPSP
jgi:hypothetical protein